MPARSPRKQQFAGGRWILRRGFALHGLRVRRLLGDDEHVEQAEKNHGRKAHTSRSEKWRSLGETILC
jgi:hypothetical protein